VSVNVSVAAPTQCGALECGDVRFSGYFCGYSLLHLLWHARRTVVRRETACRCAVGLQVPRTLVSRSEITRGVDVDYLFLLSDVVFHVYLTAVLSRAVELTR